MLPGREDEELKDEIAHDVITAEKEAIVDAGVLWPHAA